MDNKNEQRSFYGLGIAPVLLQTLEKLKYTTPTPIQYQAIPPAIEGKDVIGVAQTGTGKTLAFGIPMLQLIAQTKGYGLVILPTRELAIQVDEVLYKLGKQFGLRTTVLIGGAPMRPQVQSLSKNPHIIIATPGRLNDHLQQRTVTLDKVSILVLDEADRMLDMGFLPQINKILNALPKNRQTMLFSATIPSGIINIATANMKLPIHIEISPPGTVAENVTQEIFIVRKDTKIRLLNKILTDYRGSALVFIRTKHSAARITKAIRVMGNSAVEIHSNRSLSQRREALEGFKSGKYRVLVATDIAARGIDVSGIELVINYDLPGSSEDYVHRIGRTGRAGAKGHAVSFALPEERYEIRNIEKLIRKNLPVSQLPELPQESPELIEHLYKESQRRYEEPVSSSRARGSSSGSRSYPRRPAPRRPRPSRRW